MEKKIYDVEVFFNYFCVGIQDFSNKEIFFWEISEETNQIEMIYNWFVNYDGFLISFNGVHYDNMIIKYILSNYKKLKNKPYHEICFLLKSFSDKVIDNNFDDSEVKFHKYYKTNWIDIDLLLYWSKMLRLSKQISLKSLGIQLNYPVVQELPFSPSTYLKKEDLPLIREYNSKHDLGITYLLAKKMENDIALRAYIKKEYNLDCWSMDAPKIASEYLLNYYCEQTYTGGISYYEYRKQIKDTKYEPLPWIIGDYLPEVNFKTKVFKDLYTKIINSYNTENKTTNFVFNQISGHSVLFSVSNGGIHTVNDNQIYIEDNNYLIIDADVASLYPTLFRVYKLLKPEYRIILNKYVQMIDDRIIAKRNGDKKKDLFLKLCNNAFSGLVDSNTSWLYSPEYILALRILGQFIQLRFAEELNEEGIDILFSNTDGTLVRCPKNKINVYHQIALKISQEFKFEWEFAVLEKIFFSNTNTYLSVIRKEYLLDENVNLKNIKDHIKIKRKGAYFRYGDDIPLGDSVNEQVIAKALEAYFVKNIDIVEYIKNPYKYGNTIFDYCKSNKVSKKYKVYYNNEVVQNLNRYYFSTKGYYLFKKKFDKSTYEHLNVGEGVILYNNHTEYENFDDYDVNYNYYISKTKKIIDEINNKYQLSLF